MSFTEAFKDMMVGVAVATTNGQGRFAYKMAEKAVDMVAEGITEVVNNADVCDGCRIKLSAETAKLVDQLQMLGNIEDHAKSSTHHRREDFVECGGCKGYGYLRGAGIHGRERCTSCGGTGRILKETEASPAVEGRLVCSRCGKAPDRKDAKSLLGEIKGEPVCFRCGSK